MIYGVVLIVHVIVSLILVAIILVQGGRGGMAEALGGSGAQSLFGGGANVVMTKITAIGAGVFLATCLILARLSTDRGRSIIEGLPTALPEAALPGIVPTERPSSASEEPAVTQTEPPPAETTPTTP